MILEQLTTYSDCEVSLTHSPSHHALSLDWDLGSCIRFQDIIVTRYGNCLPEIIQSSRTVVPNFWQPGSVLWKTNFPWPWGDWGVDVQDDSSA